MTAHEGLENAPRRMYELHLYFIFHATKTHIRSSKLYTKSTPRQQQVNPVKTKGDFVTTDQPSFSGKLADENVFYGLRFVRKALIKTSAQWPSTQHSSSYTHNYPENHRAKTCLYSCFFFFFFFFFLH